VNHNRLKMEGKEIKLLRQQIDKLNVKDFDLQGWKKYTIIILARIFGDNNEKIRQIEKLEYRFSSWSLRDASGNESYEEGTKKLAREILSAAISEIETFGPPVISEDYHADQTVEELVSILLDELKGSQVKQLKTILLSRENKEEKQRKIKEILEGLGEYGAYDILTSMLMHKAFIQFFKKS
jgi:hypothetical protein